MCECGVCKTCKNREKMRKYRANHREALRAYDRRRRAADPEKFRARSRQKDTKEASRLYRERNRQKSRARGIVSSAVRRGVLVRQPCERCGDARTEAHHDDYSKPYNVRWLCKRCHVAEHYGEAVA